METVRARMDLILDHYEDLEESRKALAALAAAATMAGASAPSTAKAHPVKDAKKFQQTSHDWGKMHTDDVVHAMKAHKHPGARKFLHKQVRRGGNLNVKHGLSRLAHQARQSKKQRKWSKGGETTQLAQNIKTRRPGRR
jgi:hypothetical protein